MAKRGRPKGSGNTSVAKAEDEANIKLNLRKLLDKSTVVKIDGKSVRVREEEAMHRAMIAKAKKGNVMAYNSVMDRIYGKVVAQEDGSRPTIPQNIAFIWKGELPKEPEKVEQPAEEFEEIEIEEKPVTRKDIWADFDAKHEEE